jgi:hypothetical protein
MVFIELPLFRKYVEFSDDELREIQSTLIDNPKAGDVIRGGGGLRKLRVALPGRGKRSGARVIYVYVDAQARCYLVLAYPKNVMEDLSREQLSALAQLMRGITDADG